MKKKLLFILPILFLIFCALFRTELGYTFSAMVDPDYAYLFNGLNLASPSLIIGHIDHPGTPLQVYCAIIFRVTNAFFGTNSFLEDTLLNPEFYISTVIFSIIILNTVLLYFVGKTVYSCTNKIESGLFLQITPFVSHLLLAIISKRLMPEPFLICVILLMLILLFKYLYLASEEHKKEKYLIIGLAVISAFGLATKLTFLPIIFIPAFLIWNLRKNILYFAMVLFSFCVFILPVFKYWVKFRNWVEDLFIHSERYGTGDKNIVNVTTFKHNLGLILNGERFFSIVFILLCLFCFAYFIPLFKLREKKDLKYRLLLGTVFAIGFGIAMVAKHYAPHYLVPVMALIVLGLFLAIEISVKTQSPFIRKIITLLSIIFIVSLPITRYKQLSSELPYYRNCIIERNNTIQFFNENIKDNAFVMVPSEYTSSFKEFGLLFGLAWCGDKRDSYINILTKLYPRFYYFLKYDNGFHDLLNKYQPLDILKKNNKLLLYFAENNTSFENECLSKFKINSVSGDIKIKKVFENDKTNEKFYSIQYCKDTLRKIEIKSQILCDMETLSPDKQCFITPGKQLFKQGNSQSNEYAYSGKYSSKQSGEYSGITYEIPMVLENEKYQISILRKKENTTCYLVVSASKSEVFYEATNTSFNEKNGWEELTLEITIPQKMQNQKLLVYTWNPPGTSPAYFDDLKILKIK